MSSMISALESVLDKDQQTLKRILDPLPSNPPPLSHIDIAERIKEQRDESKTLPRRVFKSPGELNAYLQSPEFLAEELALSKDSTSIDTPRWNRLPEEEEIVYAKRTIESIHNVKVSNIPEDLKKHYEGLEIAWKEILERAQKRKEAKKRAFPVSYGSKPPPLAEVPPSTPLVGYCEPIVDCISALRGLQTDINRYKETIRTLEAENQYTKRCLAATDHCFEEQTERMLVLTRSLHEAQERIRVLEQKESIQQKSPQPEVIHWWSDEGPTVTRHTAPLEKEPLASSSSEASVVPGHVQPTE